MNVIKEIKEMAKKKGRQAAYKEMKNPRDNRKQRSYVSPKIEVSELPNIEFLDREQLERLLAKKAREMNKE